MNRRSGDSSQPEKFYERIRQIHGGTDVSMATRMDVQDEKRERFVPQQINSVFCQSMFHLLSYCWSWLQAIQEPLRKVTILVLGLDGAGKSSIIQEIQRVLSCEILLSTKPNQTKLRVDRFEVSLVDLAGGPKSWGVWRNHYGTAHGIIFVLDSSDTVRMEEAKKTLSRVLGHPKISGKPLLLLGNKQDKPDALLPCEIIERLSLEKMVNENKSHCRVEPCSATKRLPKSQCWPIVQGLRWLLHIIAINYGALCGRTQEDSPERRRSAEGEALRKAQGARCKRESPATKKNYQKGNTGKEESQSLKNSSSLAQSSQKEEKATEPKKRKGKPKLKVKKKGLVQSEDALAEEESCRGATSRSKAGTVPGLRSTNRVAQGSPRAKTPPFPRPSTKKKNNILKNKIRTQEPAQTCPNESISSTFDLYRKAMLALKKQQEGQKTQSTAVS